MAEEQKPVLAEAPAIVEPTPAPVTETPALETKAEEPVAATETPATAETSAEVAPAAEEKVTKAEKPVEPIYSGALGYKAPGLKNAFRYSKKYFWFGEEPVSAESLSTYLRGEKAEIAQPTAAWSSQTGKGLLYFVKHADQKATPAGVLNLAEVTDLTKDGVVAFHFKLHGHKHAFEASTAPERNGWYVAVETAVAEAKETKKDLVESAGYKEQLEKLSKPALAVASASAAKEVIPKKSTEVKPTEPAAARTGSSSSSSSDNEDKKKKASKSKSRSVSRGKRTSIFGALLNKKDQLEEKKEEKKEEKAEKKEEKKEEKAEKKEEKKEEKAEKKEEKKEAKAEKKEEKAIEKGEPSSAAPIEPLVAAPIIEAPKEETAAPVTEATEEPVIPTTETPETKPKPTKRGSIFGNFREKLRSPTTEKKEPEFAPPVPAKETAAETAPKVEEPVAPIVAAETAEAPKVEETPKTETPAAAVTTPAEKKEPFSFSKFFPKEKAKSPAVETPAPVTAEAEAPKAEEIPAVVEPTEAPKEELKTEEPVLPVTEEATGTPETKPKPTKRGSIFGNLTNSAKKEKTEGEVEPKEQPKKENKLTGLFRSASKSVKPLSKKEKEPTTPAKVEEKEEPTAEEPAAAVEPTATEATSEPKIIGDVVPDAVTVGHAPESTPAVSATA